MNFDMFQGYFRAFRLDEVKIIGKDVTLDGECLHVVGIGRKRNVTMEGQSYMFWSSSRHGRTAPWIGDIRQKGNPCWKQKGRTTVIRHYVSVKSK